MELAISAWPLHTWMSASLAVHRKASSAVPGQVAVNLVLHMLSGKPRPVRGWILQHGPQLCACVEVWLSSPDQLPET